ncbi:MAG: CPBP family glutamic-type intramembrane protease [Gammaproteobacteria bacterium]
MLRSIGIALFPLAVLLSAASAACILGYFAVLGLGDQFPFRKVISKTTQLLLVLSIFPMMAWLNLQWRDIGFADKTLFVKQLVKGFALGLLTLLPVFIIEYLLGIHVVDRSKEWTLAYAAQKISVSLALALLISLIEEPLFRGILLTGLKKKLPMAAAVLISSVYYAGLHFLNSHIEIPLQELTVFSGFTLLVDAFANLLNPINRSAFVALLMVGIFLSLLRTRFKATLGLCIGCHTAWVWQIKMSKSLFSFNYKTEFLYLVSPYDGVIGPLVTGWLMLAMIGYVAYRKFVLHTG